MSIIKIYYFLRSIAIVKYFTKIKSSFIYIDSLVVKINFFFKFVKLSYKALTKFKFRVFNNILSVAFRVASYKPSKPAFVVTTSAGLGRFLLDID